MVASMDFLTGFIAAGILCLGIKVAIDTVKKRQEAEAEAEKELLERAAARQPGFDRDRFKARIMGLAEDDPLWPQLLGLVDACVESELGPLVISGLPDAEAHRLRGRVGMLMDFKADLEKVWAETHPKAAGKEG